MKGKQSPSRAHGEAEKGKIGKRDKVKSVYDILLTGFFGVKVLDRYHMMGGEETKWKRVAIRVWQLQAVSAM
jgi:hypothetical protein